MARSFSLALAKFAQKAGHNADLVHRKVALEMTSRIVLRTPVSTGRARANWHVAIGAPALGISDVTDPTGGKTIAAAAQTLAGFRSGPSIWITNGLPYIQGLEDGTGSKQAPQGMVGITVREFQGLVSRAATEVRR